MLSEMVAIVCWMCLFWTSAAASSDGEADLVTFPYQERRVSFKQYSGYLDVLPTRHIHYIYVESQQNPETDPVVFWTNGGTVVTPLPSAIQMSRRAHSGHTCRTWVLGAAGIFG